MSAILPPPPYVKDIPTVTITSSPDRAIPASSTPSTGLKSPRTARFAEATAVYSPIEPSAASNPFKDPPATTNHYTPQPQISDIGFGYVNKASHISVEIEETDERYLAPMTPKFPPKSPGPLKSALKSPGAAPRNLDAMLSPTFREENALEKAEKITDQEQARDFKAKVRVRYAKFVTRCVSFSCSLIVLSMLAATFTIFNASRSLAPRNGLPAWAPNTPIWPQVTILVIACISLILCIAVFWGYCRGGHRRAEKVAVYYTTFTVAFFVFSIVMWGVGAAILNESRNKGGGTDIWGWACKDNKRRQVFQNDVNYALVCRLQNWSLICAIIEIVLEIITIAIYGIVFFRYYSKRRLRKTMQARDNARSDLYLAQLKAQSAPNTPGLPGGLLSPRDGGWRPPQGFESYNADRASVVAAQNAEKNVALTAPVASDEPQRYVTITERKIIEPKPFTLQAPPSKTRRADGASVAGSSPISPVSPHEQFNEHVPAAPGEVQYASVSIPGSYAAPQSPGFLPPAPR